MSTPWHQLRIVAFDTETTGLSPFDGDRIVEFAAVELHVAADLSVGRVVSHDFLINPEVPIPRAATKVSGITDDDVADAPLFEEKADAIRDLLQGAVLIAHNLSFDLNFVRAELRRCGRWWPATLAEIDTLALAQRRLPELKSHKLEVVARELGIPLDTAHRATFDAEACGRVLVELARRQGAPRELDGLVDWADAVSPPPDTGHLRLGPRGVPEFLDGPFAGRSVEEAPDHLQWMAMALERHDGAWRARYPDSVRQWARRWLRVRGAGRARTPGRGGGSQDWTIDPAPWRSAP
jgi:DNA polymerase III subunit epsilon